MRSREAGAALVVTLVTITALLVLGALTVRTMRAEVGAADRFTAAALYAAESGVSAGIEHLRGRCAGGGPIAGNGARPGEPGNLFDAVDRAARAWYEVSIVREEAGGVAVLRSLGHAAGGATATVEVEVAGECGGTFEILGWRQIY
jgi:hypothetical protein